MQVVWDLLGSTSDKESACNEETWVQFLGQEDSLKERMAIHFIVLGWRIPWKNKAENKTKQKNPLELYNSLLLRVNGFWVRTT